MSRPWHGTIYPRAKMAVFICQDAVKRQLLNTSAMAEPSSPTLILERQEENKPGQELVKNYQSIKQNHVIWKQMFSELGFPVPPLHKAAVLLPAGQEGKVKARVAQCSPDGSAQHRREAVSGQHQPQSQLLAEGLEIPFVSRPISPKKIEFFLCECISYT